MDQKSKKLSCSVCSNEIPKSAKEMPEGAEYAQHFCSDECHDHWRSNLDQVEDLSDRIANPEKFYDSPRHVLHDSNLSDDAKLKILRSWENDAIEIMTGGARPHLSEIKKAIIELKQK